MAVPLDDSDASSTGFNAFGSWLSPLSPQRNRSTVRPDFNPRRMDYNPWAVMGSMISATQDAALARRKAIEQHQAMQLLGQQKYLPGYEGMQGAEMPNWLGKLCAANPDLAMKFNEQVAAPFAMQRDIRKEVQIEAAKRQANLDSGMTLAKWLGLVPNR